MTEFAEQYLSNLKEVDGFILKAQSPSCGLRDVKITPATDNPHTLRRGAGMFAENVMERFGGLAVEDELRLSNYRLRTHFLTQLFVYGRWRELKKKAGMKALVKFHADNKLLFMTYDQALMREMGRLIANDRKQTVAQIAAAYEERLMRMFRRVPASGAHINTIMHALGYFKKELTKEEKAFFVKCLGRYKRKQLPLMALVHMVRGWIIKYKNDYLNSQSYFTPFPEELVDLTDTARGEC